MSMAQLVELSPYSISGENGKKVFIGKKETSLLLVELETGRIKATLGSEECPWDWPDFQMDEEDDGLGGTPFQTHNGARCSCRLLKTYSRT